MTAPALAQHEISLLKANYVRHYRARLKADVRAGRVDAATVIANPPEEVRSMQVVQLLMCTRRVGRAKSIALMRSVDATEWKTIGELSERQRGLIVEGLRR